VRWRAVIGMLGLVVVVVSVFLALSTAPRPDTPSLPLPVAVTTPAPSPSLTSLGTATPASSTTKTVQPATATAQIATPRGNPVGVRISRQGTTVLNERISGPIGLERDGRGNLVYLNGETVLEPPLTTVGWYHEQGAWPKPGYPGPSVLVAHISHQGKPGPFWNLDLVATGDVVTVAYDSGDKVTFHVTQNPDHMPKVDLPGGKIWNKTQKPVLRLITCDPSTPFRAGHYAGNIIVYADQRE
jgi:hypothetical protein